MNREGIDCGYFLLKEKFLPNKYKEYHGYEILIAILMPSFLLMVSRFD